ncbi:hypothetical protein TIFTF001_004982 [Ficus carica]|uniref:Uncharacterized protein n=1 Tax=Ficus carica TaxID=3494 RepID=A0AA88CY15_FICCA|nr:hypothetical protein TIFTF001_004982 [Ficus carica]
MMKISITTTNGKLAVFIVESKTNVRALGFSPGEDLEKVLRRESLKLPAEIESLACTRSNVMFHDVFNRRNCPCRFAHALTRIDDKH